MTFPSLPPPLRHLLPHRYRRRAHRRRLNLMLYLLLTILIILTPLYLIYKPPVTLINYFSRRWPDVLWHIPADLLAQTHVIPGTTTRKAPAKVVALTIDDVPSEYTEEILRLLERYNATATLFVLGNQVQGREDVLRKAVEQGCELANHAMFDAPSKDLSDVELAQQIKDVEAMITNIYTFANTPPNTKPPRYFRPGSGFFSTRMLKLVKSLGYRLVLGSIYPHDPQIPYARVNAAHVLSMLRPGGIIIVHDRRSWTVPMLERVLGVGTGRGWRFVGVSEMLGLVEDGEG